METDIFKHIKIIIFTKFMFVKMTKQHIFILENNLQKVGQSFFHFSRQTTVIQDLHFRRQFSLVPDNRTNVNVEACSVMRLKKFVTVDEGCLAPLFREF
jgi:hypothetical protein